MSLLSKLHISWLDKYLKFIPVVQQLQQAAQMVTSFISAMERGDYAGAFKGLMQPMLQIAISAALDATGVGASISELGDKLAGQLGDMVPGMLNELNAQGAPKFVIDAFSQEMQNMQAYLKSDLFVKDMCNELGKTGGDVILNAGDIEKLKGGMLLNFLSDVGTKGFMNSLAMTPTSTKQAADLSTSEYAPKIISGGSYTDPYQPAPPTRYSTPGAVVSRDMGANQNA